MFWKKKFRIETNTGHILKTESEIQEYISHLETEKWAIQRELDEIKPILEDPRIVPAISKNCEECAFAVFGHKYYTSYPNHVHVCKQLLGCRKEALCDDFKSLEDE